MTPPLPPAFHLGISDRGEKGGGRGLRSLAPSAADRGQRGAELSGTSGQPPAVVAPGEPRECTGAARAQQ